MKNSKETKVENLKINEQKLKRNYAIKGTLTGLAISCIPIGIAVASNVFGTDIRISDTSFIGDFVNTAYSAIETWPGAIITGSAITAASYIAGMDKAEKKLRKVK